MQNVFSHRTTSFLLLISFIVVAFVGTITFSSLRPDQAVAYKPIEQKNQDSIRTLDPVPFHELYTKPNEKYLYTASWQEVRSAQSQHGFTLNTHDGFNGYIFKKPGVHTKPFYRLKKLSTGNWLYTASETEKNALLEKGTFRLEGGSGELQGVAGYIASTKLPGTEQFSRYSNGSSWRFVFSSQTPPAGYKFDGVVGYLPHTFYKVGAYYFGMFNQEGSAKVRKGTEALYGRDDWWGGVKDFYGQEQDVPQNTRGWPGDFSHLKPAIGYYDNSDPKTLEKHIDQAYAAGLSYFNFYYYWSDVTKKPTIDGGLKAYLQAANRNKLEFTISPCFHSSDNLFLQKQDFPQAAAAIASVVAEPNFLKTQSGRPLMFMCDVRGIDRDNAASINEFVDLLKQTVKAQTGQDLFVMHHSEYGANRVAQLPSDGLACLNHNQSIVAGSYDNYLASIQGYYNMYDRLRPTMRCITTNFNEMTRTDITKPRSAIRYYRDHTHEKYRDALARTKASMDTAFPSEIDNYVVVFAWNEWNEGAVLEPNIRDGKNLQSLQEIFGLSKPTETCLRACKQ